MLYLSSISYLGYHIPLLRGNGSVAFDRGNHNSFERLMNARAIGGLEIQPSGKEVQSQFLTDET
jgi:hypothetical protein